MKISSSLMIACASLLMASFANAEGLPAVGNAAPDFSLSSQEGTAVSLHDYKGKWVVLYFYPKDMTQGCTIEAHNFERDLAQYKAKDAVILGVSVDSVDSHKEFCTKESLSFKLLADTNKEVTGKYGSLAANGAVAARNTFLIDPNGKVQKVYEKVKPQQHSEEVLAELGTLKK